MIVFKTTQGFKVIPLKTARALILDHDYVRPLSATTSTQLLHRPIQEILKKENERTQEAKPAALNHIGLVYQNPELGAEASEGAIDNSSDSCCCSELNNTEDMDQEDDSCLDEFLNFMETTPNDVAEKSERKQNSPMRAKKSAKYDSHGKPTTYSEVRRMIATYFCGGCATKFPSLPALTEHAAERICFMEKHTCRTCDMSFADRNGLVRHRKVHSVPKSKLLCPTCQRPFSTVDAKNLHMNAYHTNDFDMTPAGILQCKHCEFQVKNIVNIRRHVLTRHVKIKDWLCDTCGKSFTDKKDFERHVVRHDDARPFSCSICDKSARTKVDLKRHMISHTTIRRHVCDVCAKAFKDVYKLNRHKKKHNGPFPFACKGCDKCYVTRFELDMHRKRSQNGDCK